MPNIWKSFLRPKAAPYQFPDTEELVDEPEPAPEPEPEPGPGEAGGPDAADGGEEDRVPDVISFAQVQAEKILADARLQAEELRTQALARAQAEIDQAKADGRDEGFRQGYQDGLGQARVEVQNQVQEQLRREAAQVEEFLKSADRARAEMLEQTKGELCDLSVAIAEKIIHISLKSSREVIGRMIQVAAEKLKRREWVHIYIGGVDTRTAAQIAPELTASLAGLSDHIKIIPMAEDESGTCILEMPDEIIDASVSTQLQNIRDLMGEA